MVLDPRVIAGLFVLWDALLVTSMRRNPYGKTGKNRHDDSDEDFDYAAWKKHAAFADKAVPGWAGNILDRYGRGETKLVFLGYCPDTLYMCRELTGQGTCSPFPTDEQ